MEKTCNQEVTTESTGVWVPLSSSPYCSSSPSSRPHRSSTSDRRNIASHDVTLCAAYPSNYATNSSRQASTPDHIAAATHPHCATSGPSASTPIHAGRCHSTPIQARRRLSYAAPDGAPRGWLPLILSAPCFADQKRRLYTQIVILCIFLCAVAVVVITHLIQLFVDNVRSLCLHANRMYLGTDAVGRFPHINETYEA